MTKINSDKIKTGARNSPLSKAQTKEVLEALRKFHPSIDFETIFVQTYGDKDQSTSLRTLDKTDFFTRELDQLLLKGQCRIAIHSAKDLPDPLPEGLKVAALTAGVDSSDSLVLPSGLAFAALPANSLIATSSDRREEAVRSLRSDLKFTDIRGTIEQRLKKMEEGMVSGVVIAEAAIIRLGLTHLNRICLPGPTAPLQGKLAILCKDQDHEMEDLFQCIDSRKKVLYLGIDPPSPSIEKNFIHFPIIKTIPKPMDSLRPFLKKTYSHLIFTSKTAVRIFFDYLPKLGIGQEYLKDTGIIAVGSKTAALIEKYGFAVNITAEEESSEGIIKELKKISLASAHILWPHSSLSRTVILDFFKAQGIRCDSAVLYETVPNELDSLPDLDKVDEFFFTSPSTVDAFIKFFGTLPKNKPLHSIGPVTEARLHEARGSNQGLGLQK